MHMGDGCRTSFLRLVRSILIYVPHNYRYSDMIYVCTMEPLDEAKLASVLTE